mgnify:CR=1 FL=1
MKPKKGIAVDASCRSGSGTNGAGVVEWRGVDLETGKEIFSSDIYPEGTISQGECAAIFDGVKWCIDNGHPGPVYSDSVTAIAWANGKTPKMTPTKASAAMCERIWSDLGWAELDEVRAVIKSHLMKWETDKWGENPADLGYKGYQKVRIWAIASGRVTGIRNSWSECANAVVGHLGARFASFPKEKLSEAKEWVEKTGESAKAIRIRKNALMADGPQPAFTCNYDCCAYPACMCGL